MLFEEGFGACIMLFEGWLSSHNSFVGGAVTILGFFLYCWR